MPDGLRSVSACSAAISGSATPSQDVLDAIIARSAEGVALIFRGRTFTYRELRVLVSDCARSLLASSTAGELMAVWLPNGVEILALHLACLKTGVIPMPLHQGMKWPEVRETLAHARVKVLVTSRQLADLHSEALSGTGLHRIYVVDPGDAPQLYRSFAKTTAHDGAQDSSPARSTRMGLVLHTSGSKGRAKAVMLSRESVDHIVRDRIARASLTPQSVLVVASCLTQSVGLYQSLAVLAAGGTLVLLESYDVDLMVEAVHRHRPTHLIMVVEAFDRLLHDPRITAGSLGSLSFACVGADRVTSRVQDRFIALTGGALAVSYGLTESSWALFNPGDRIDKRLALGRAGRHVAVSVRGPAGSEAAIGEVGEIYVRSPRTMLGYLGDEEMTREAFVDGWLATGDLAYQDAEGYFWFAGRKKNMIVLSSGDNVSPVEVENVILTHPAVSHCSVVGAAGPNGSEVPCAFVTRRDESLSQADLEQFLRERLSDFKLPRRFEFVAARPVGLTGKIHVGVPNDVESTLRCTT